MINFQESAAGGKDRPSARTSNGSVDSATKRSDRDAAPLSSHLVGTQAQPVVKTFVNTTNNGLKVKMPDSVHIFLPGETIEFLPKELGEDGADRELSRRARRAEMKSKASMDWAKRNKEK